MTTPSLLTPTPSNDLATLQAQVAQDIKQRLITTEGYLIARHNDVMKLVWQNAKLTPQQVCDALGTNAGTLFSIGGLTATYISGVDPGSLNKLSVPLSGFAISTSGTVTVSGVPYSR